LRQLLRWPVRSCESTMWEEEQEDGTLIIYTMCSHLKKPQAMCVYGGEAYRVAAWEALREELRAHTMCSDPW
jgi:hypothetical protein